MSADGRARVERMAVLAAALAAVLEHDRELLHPAQLGALRRAAQAVRIQRRRW